MAFFAITHGLTTGKCNLPTEYPRPRVVGKSLVGNSLPVNMPWVTLPTAYPMVLSRTSQWIVIHGKAMSKHYPRHCHGLSKFYKKNKINVYYFLVATSTTYKCLNNFKQKATTYKKLVKEITIHKHQRSTVIEKNVK
jgi:hypothetical protein